MALDDLKKRIFRPNEEFRSRMEEPRLGKHAKKEVGGWKESPRREGSAPASGNIAKRIIWLGVGIGFFVVISVAAYVFFIGGGVSGGNTQKLINLRVDGFEEVLAGKKAIWKVVYKNDNPIALKNARIIFEFPAGTQPLVGKFSNAGVLKEVREIGTVQAGGSGEEIFSALLFGAEGSIAEGKASLEYRPENSSARFIKERGYSSRIKGTLLGVSVDIPDGLQVGQDAEVVVHVTSSAESVFRGLWLGLDYPGAFEFVSSEPLPEDGNNVWLLGDVPAGAERVITIHGVIKLSESDQVFRARVGLFDRARASWADFATTAESFSVIPSLLAVNLDVTDGEISHGVVPEGERIFVSVNWRNNLPVAVRNVSVEVKIDSAALDLKTLRSSLGEFIGRTNSVKWVPGRVPSLSVLEPGATGRFSFDVETYKQIPINSKKDKNFYINLDAAISSNDKPQGFEGVNISGKGNMQLKVSTHPTIAQNGYYFDSRIKNTGPLPPRVGEETTYTIVWSLLNTVNDLDDVTVSAHLPPYIEWKGVVDPADASITYEEATGLVRWSLGRLDSGTGYINPPRELAFQIGFTPSAPQIGDAPQLSPPAALEAKDTFTGTLFNVESAQERTYIMNDTRASEFGGAVRQ